MTETGLKRLKMLTTELRDHNTEAVYFFLSDNGPTSLSGFKYLRKVSLMEDKLNASGQLVRAGEHNSLSYLWRGHRVRRKGKCQPLWKYRQL